MTTDQILIFALLGAVIALFVWGRFRYDLVALAALIAAVFLGLVSPHEAFSGFASSAVITVAAVLVISKGLTVSGAIERVAGVLLPRVESVTLQMGGLNAFTGALSAMMNNVGALALLMPATIEAAKKLKQAPSMFLMPLSFASILGGMVTLIGTPPNIIIADLRRDLLGAPYQMFDFSPVGGPVAVIGIIFVTLVGWRFLPKKRRGKPEGEELFEIEGYVAEVKVPKDSKHAGKKIHELDEAAHEYGIHIAGIVRKKKRILAVRPAEKVQAGDILILEADPDDLDKFAHKFGFEIKGGTEKDRKAFTSDDVVLVEAVVSGDSRLAGRQVGALRLKSRHINLLGISRQGATLRKSLEKVKLRVGDVLLLQAERDTYSATLASLGLLPLAERGFSMGKRHQAWIAIGLLAAAVGAASTGVVSLTIALAAAALGMVLSSIVAVEEVYDSIDWPVIVLVGAMIPIGGALQTVGATELMAGWIVGFSSALPIYVLLGILLLATMTLSDVMNNVATAVVMAPIAVSIAETLGVNPDSFLMAVAVGASCAFLTPIGHKNNALILGPGGYKFGDYWRMGLPLEILIVLAGVPLIMWAWPL